jgi:hypothetical protein
MKREEGYYWVKYEDEWHIAQYRHEQKEAPAAWTLCAYVDDSWWHYDGDFEEIDERRISREPEKQKIKPVRLYYTDPPEVTDCPDGYCNYIGKCKNDGDCLRYKQQKDSGLGNKLFGLL